MPLRNPVLRQLRRRRIPTWWQDAKLGIFVHWTPASVPGVRARRHGDRRAAAVRPARRAGVVAVHRVVRELVALPRQPRRPPPPRGLRRPPVRRIRGRLGSRARRVGPRRVGRRASPRPARAMSCSSPSITTATASGRPTCANPHRSGLALRRDVVGELAEAVRGVGLRFGLYYSGGLDWTFDDRPMGSLADMLAAIPRGDYPAYADAQVRELIARYRPSVLWNDIAWPADGKQLWPLFAHYYEQVPDGVVNDRWMPWNPLLGATRPQPGRSVSIDAGARRQAQRRLGHRPAEAAAFRRAHARVRGLRRRAAHPVGVRAGHGSQLRLQRGVATRATSSRDDELLWSFVDIVAKGGNLLLNVGPRGGGRGDPRRAADSPRLARGMDRPRVDAVRGDVALGLERHDDIRWPRSPLHRRRRPAVRVPARARRHGDAARCPVDADDDGVDHRRCTTGVARHRPRTRRRRFGGIGARRARRGPPRGCRRALTSGVGARRGRESGRPPVRASRSRCNRTIRRTRSGRHATIVAPAPRALSASASGSSAAPPPASTSGRMASRSRGLHGDVGLAVHSTERVVEQPPARGPAWRRHHRVVAQFPQRHRRAHACAARRRVGRRGRRSGRGAGPPRARPTWMVGR